MRKTTLIRACAAAVVSSTFLIPAPVRAQGPLQPVLTGLNNPYGLAFGPDGSLYVAEAGTGNGLAGTGPGFLDGGGDQVYFGDTGSVSRLANGVQSRVVTGLPSLGPAGGGETTGLSGLAFDGGGTLYGVFGFGGTEAQRTTLVANVLTATGGTTTNAADLGQVVRLTPATNGVTPVSDLVPYETANYAANNPGGSTPEANPYALAALPGGGFAASDGGGNVVFKVAAAGGSPSLLTLLPAVPNPAAGPPTYQSVPTALALNASGGLFVGEFTGYPFPVGGASVLALNASTGAATAFATGFTTITGMAFGPDGNLYVVDLTTNGLAAANPGDADLFQFNPRTGRTALLADLGAGSTYTDLIAGPDNALYLSVQGATAGSGQVLRYSLSSVPEPAAVPVVGCGLAAVGLLARRRVGSRA